MGVSGSGKTTLGEALAGRLGWDFFDADEFHSTENISKMASGNPLSDSDRLPWLAALNDLLLSTLRADRHPVLACSALKEAYRKRLLEDVEDMAVIYLKGEFNLIWSRLSRREGHFMKADMLQSQFETLEEPADALVLDMSMPLERMLDTIAERYFP